MCCVLVLSFWKWIYILVLGNRLNWFYKIKENQLVLILAVLHFTLISAKIQVFKKIQSSNALQYNSKSWNYAPTSSTMYFNLSIMRNWQSFDLPFFGNQFSTSSQRANVPAGTFSLINFNWENVVCRACVYTRTGTLQPPTPIRFWHTH